MSLSTNKLINSIQLSTTFDSSTIANSIATFIEKDFLIIITGTRDGLIFCHSLNWEFEEYARPKIMNTRSYRVGSFPVALSKSADESIIAMCNYPFKITLISRTVRIDPILHSQFIRAVPFLYENNGMMILEKSAMAFVTLAPKAEYVIRNYPVSNVLFKCNE